MKREFDYKALFEEFTNMDLSDKNSYGKVEVGARWQHSQDSELIERLQAENAKLKNIEVLYRVSQVTSYTEEQYRVLESQNTELKRRVEELRKAAGKVIHHAIEAQLKFSTEDLILMPNKEFRNLSALGDSISNLNVALAKLSEPGVGGVGDSV